MVGLVEKMTQLNRFFDLSGMQYFDIDRSILHFAIEIVESSLLDANKRGWKRDYSVPTEAMLPAENIALSFGGLETFMMFRDLHAPGFISVVKSDGFSSELEPCGAYEPGGSIRQCERGDLRLESEGWCLTLLAAHVVAVMNQPMLVTRAPAASRQQRRAAHRGMGVAVDAWTRVTWDLSKETQAKISRDEEFHKVPLHYRRAHWRKALPHYVGAVQRPDAIRVEDRPLWWQWIEGTWVGHPMFGIKRSVYAPKMSTGTLARRKSSRTDRRKQKGLTDSSHSA